jgi:hypothetical protein
MEPFWLEDPRILLKNDKAFQFLPTPQMPFTSRLNAITRFCIYLFGILFLISDSDVWLYIPVISVLVMVLLWVLNQKSDEVDTSSPQVKKNVAARSTASKKSRRQPTYENPFMNHLPSDYEGGDDNASLVEERLSQPSEEWTKVKDDVDEQYYANMYRNSSDLYEQESSKRSFYSMPSTTVPNDQEAFANWCYRAPTTCKETGEGCLKYIDPRNERRVSREEYII